MKSINNARKVAVATDSHGAVDLAVSYGFGLLVSKITDWRAIKAVMLKLTDMAVSRPDGEGGEFEQGGSNLPGLWNLFMLSYRDPEYFEQGPKWDAFNQIYSAEYSELLMRSPGFDPESR